MEEDLQAVAAKLRRRLAQLEKGES
jgi:hypothetical protein